MKNNKELTPMMELIERINNFEYVLHKQDIIDMINELLPKEKQVIEDAFRDGAIDEMHKKYTLVQDYYNTKYNNQIK